jgi:hypothetical protein
MNQQAWEWLMAAARQRATVYQQRSRVIAVILPDRAARIRGTRWSYVIVSAEDSH